MLSSCVWGRKKLFGEQLPILCQPFIFSALMFHRKVPLFLSKAKPILDLISPHLLVFLFSKFPLLFLYFLTFSSDLGSFFKLHPSLAKAINKFHICTSNVFIFREHHGSWHCGPLPSILILSLIYSNNTFCWCYASLLAPTSMNIPSLYISCFLCFLLLLTQCSPGSAFCPFHHPILTSSTTTASTVINTHMTAKSITLDKNSLLHSSQYVQLPWGHLHWAFFKYLNLFPGGSETGQKSIYFDESFKYQRGNSGWKIIKSEIVHVICIGITVQVLLPLYIGNISCQIHYIY